MQEETGLMKLIDVASQAQAGLAKLLKRTELEAIPYTPETEAFAINAIRFLTEQGRTFAKLSAQKRGMFFVWIRKNVTKHGEFEAFCHKHFPDVKDRIRELWMASYLLAIGEKKPKELPAPDDDELENGELVADLMDPKSDKVAKLPRAAILDHARKLEKKITTGAEQLAARDAEIEALREQVRKGRDGDLIPAHITDELTRAEHVRLAFWSFVKKWITNLPQEEVRLKVHLALYGELKSSMMELWETHLGPQMEAREEREAKAAWKKNKHIAEGQAAEAEATARLGAGHE